MIRFFIRLLNYTLLVCFLGFLWGGWYLSQRGFNQRWRKKLSEEFAKRGVELTAARLTLDPLRGLVAREVRVFRNANRRDIIARTDELRLDINYTRLLRNEPFLDALSLSDADIRLDLDPRRPNSGEFTIHLNAVQLNFSPDRWEIRRLQGEGFGVFFSIAGEIKHRVDWQSDTDTSRIWLPLKNISRDWLRALAQVEFGPQLGRLDLNFKGNLLQKNWLQSADLRLEIPSVRWKKILCQQVSAEADFADHLLNLRRLKWKDDRGELSASGEWRRGQHGRIFFDSAINAVPIFQEFKLSKKVTSGKSIRLTGDCEWQEKPKRTWQIIGKLDATELIYNSVEWDRTTAEFSITQDRCLVQNARFEQQESALTGQMYLDQEQLTANFSSTIHPKFLWKTLDQTPPTWLSEIDFPVHPLVNMRVRSISQNPYRWESNGNIVFGRTNFRGVALTSADASFFQSDSYLSLGQIQITRPEGQCTGEAFWDFQKQELTLWDVRNSLDLVAIGLWSDRALADILQTLQLPRGTVLQAAGKARWENDRLSQIRLELRSDFIPLRSLPIFSKIPAAMLEVPAPFAATAILQDRIFTLSPITAGSQEKPLSGSASWEMETRRFNGRIEQGTSVWKADSVLPEIQWQASNDPASVAK